MKDVDARARALFERSVQELDEAAVKRLRLARRATLSDAARPTLRWQAWPAGLAAAGVLALGLAWWWPHGAEPTPAPVAAASSPEASADEPVLAEADEDSDLYVFLAEAPVAADAPAGQRL